VRVHYPTRWLSVDLRNARKGRGWWRELEEHQEVIEKGFYGLVADVVAKGGAPRRSLRYCVALDGSFGRHRASRASACNCSCLRGSRISGK
jgi:hypothetical protein